MNLIDLANET
jgi:hypothetical protein